MNFISTSAVRNEVSRAGLVSLDKVSEIMLCSLSFTLISINYSLTIQSLDAPYSELRNVPLNAL